MNYVFVGKSVVVSEAIKEKTISKLDRLEKFLPEDTDVIVTFNVVKKEHKVEVTIPLPQRTLRAEVVEDDMYVAIDKVVDVLEKQLVKYKTRLKDKSRRDAKYKSEYDVYANLSVQDTTEEVEDTVIKTKRFPIKPMTVDEAIMEMDLIGHSFFVFFNGENDEVNVVYKRNDGGYGLIEPEL